MSRQIHRLTQIQVDKARPFEVVVPVPLPPGAIATERDGKVSVLLERRRRPYGVDRSADVKDDKRLRRLMHRFLEPVMTMRDGRPCIVKRKTRWLADGGSLWVKIMPSQTDPDGYSASYVFRYSLPEERISANGRTYQRQRFHGLGSCNTLRLDEAREKARECRKMLLDGIDPIVARQGKAASARVAEKKLKTFDVVMSEFLINKGEAWSKVHARNWRQSMRDHISPVIGDVPISAVDTELAIRALTDLHRDHPVTAARVMGRCADVYSYAVLHGYGAEPNPFRYKGHLEFRFPQRTEVTHLPALAFAKMSQFWNKLIRVEGVGSLATQWTIANVSRTSETLEALASEIDWERQLWLVPWSHKKTRRHNDEDVFVVPLTGLAMDILARLGKKEPDERLFPIHGSQMLNTVKDINPDITVHGFRATFKTWSREATNTDSDVVRACMSHKGGASAVDLAYHRGPLYVEKKRRHLESWAGYVAGITESADVVPMRRA